MIEGHPETGQVRPKLRDSVWSELADNEKPLARMHVYPVPRLGADFGNGEVELEGFH